MINPFRGRVRIAKRASEIFHGKAAVDCLCTVDPRRGILSILDAEDFKEHTRITLKGLIVTVMYIYNTENECNLSGCVLNLEFRCPNTSAFTNIYLATTHTAATNEWALMLSFCDVHVVGMNQTNTRTSPVETNNKTRLLYWIE